ncbi:MAG: glycogen/starch/alpha-glucan phosphorylase [Clostridiales bacterium]|nr:glycogen/starch/alpha-glucan phosphorylase [Clostridiales bacterium]
MKLKSRLESLAQNSFALPLIDCSPQQVFELLLILCRNLAYERPAPKGEKKLYYFSAEFLLGKLLSNNLLALGIYDEAKAVLSDLGLELSEIEDFEPEPSLGNGGLGRLAACFLDSIAALGLWGDGVGLNYHYGLFFQRFENHKQGEYPNPWIKPQSWLVETGLSFPVSFGSFTVNAQLKDISIPSAGTGLSNRLHLFDVEEPYPLPLSGIDFDKSDIPHCLTAFLYPDDSDEKGRLLRVYQQYFMVSAGAQLILKELDDKGFSPENLADHVSIQINDTHPSMLIPELIRLMVDRGLSMDSAIEQVRQSCAYTNHAILAEALEKWPLDFIETVAPQLVPIIQELDLRVKKAHPESPPIIDEDELVHMAYLDIHYGHSINGVAALHTDILKHTELAPFYSLYPEKFNNKTNGVSFRRWLEVCNPLLSGFITKRIGEGWKKDTSILTYLEDFVDDKDSLNELLAIKSENKRRLKQEIFRLQGAHLNENSVFDIQIKRFHEYKRQQMNALYVIYKYLEIKEGNLPPRPITVIFGGKAAPAYTMAKHIIHLILCLQSLIENDPAVSPWLQVLMVENYNVSKAELLIPACDISEQISLASKEASGTGNMKLMANGAITLGTMDGANVEIADLVGAENIYTFGKSSPQVIKLYAEESYEPLEFYHRSAIEPLVDFILSPELLAIGDPLALTALWKDLKHKDWFMSLLDLEDYIAAKEKALSDYENREAWAKKMLINIARSGFFSSDRSIAQYNEEIWQLC